MLYELKQNKAYFKIIFLTITIGKLIVTKPRLQKHNRNEALERELARERSFSRDR